MELQRDGWRVYGSAGYFSRGAIFASAAVEKAVAENAWLTGSISQSHSMKSDDLSFALGLSKNRTDVSGGVAVRVHPRAAVFGSVGRAISRDEASTDAADLHDGRVAQLRREVTAPDAGGRDPSPIQQDTESGSPHEKVIRDERHGRGRR